jgi:uncharacterized protein (TIGR02147 family)
MNVLKLDIYQYEDYRLFLTDLIGKNASIKGFRTRLATAARCQKSFLSQVMTGTVHLTPDHAANIATYLKFDHDETSFFIDMVIYARAGSEALKTFLMERIAQSTMEKQKIANRFNEATQIDFQHHAAFYSRWYVSATYMLLGQTQNLDEISHRLGIALSVVESTVETLKRIGLTVRDEEGLLINKESNLFLKESPFRNAFLSSWRHVGSLKQQLPETKSDFFTMIWSISKESKGQVKAIFLEAISAAKVICAAPQNEEELICVNLDFFDV